jgi:hypothetical protein
MDAGGDELLHLQLWGQLAEGKIDMDEGCMAEK